MRKIDLQRDESALSPITSSSKRPRYQSLDPTLSLCFAAIQSMSSSSPKIHGVLSRILLSQAIVWLSNGQPKLASKLLLSLCDFFPPTPCQVEQTNLARTTSHLPLFLLAAAKCMVHIIYISLLLLLLTNHSLTL